MQKTTIMWGVTGVLLLGGLLTVTGCRTKTDDSSMLPNGSQSAQVSETQAPEAPLTRTAPVPAGKKAYPPPTQADVDAAKAAGTRTATIKNVKGTIVAELYGADAPLTVANFVKLTKAKYYDGLAFHRVVKDFVIQGGDQAGNGSGGPGYEIRMERSPKLLHVLGALAMARSQDINSAGSQFYITTADNANTQNLDNPDSPYAVFGKVVKGLDVAQKIKQGDKIISITIK